MVDQNLSYGSQQPTAVKSFCITTNRICNYDYPCRTQGYCDLCPLCLINDCFDYWAMDEELVPADGSGSSGGVGGQGGNGGSGMYAASVQALAAKIPISAPQMDWLNSNQSVAYQLLELLADETEIDADVKDAAMITINLSMAGRLEGPFDDTYKNIIIGQRAGMNIVTELLLSYLRANVAILKIEHPTWGYFRLYYTALKEALHLGLDVIGLFPVVGEVADLTNGVLYTIEGDGTNATLSYAAAIPVAGWYAAGIKFAKRTVNTIGASTTTLKWIKRTDGVINFGDRSQLRKVIGLVTGDAKQAHHLIPWEFAGHDVVQTAAKKSGTDAFHMNELVNGIALDKTVHVEGMVHTTYNTKVQIALDDISTRYANSGTVLTPNVARTEIEALIGKIRTWIQQNPGTNLNNIIIP